MNVSTDSQHVPRLNIAWILLPQSLFLALLIFGDIGFDRPGRFGFDFGHGLFFTALYLLLLLYGIVAAARLKKFRILLTQVTLPIVLFCSTMVYSNRPPPLYDATEYQHLISKPRHEVEASLDTRGAHWSTTLIGEREEETLHLRGMRIRYSQDRVVIAVEPAD